MTAACRNATILVWHEKEYSHKQLNGRCAVGDVSRDQGHDSGDTKLNKCRGVLNDERPGFGGPAVLLVVAFDVADAIQYGAYVEAEAFVAAVGPDRTSRIQPVADGVFGAFYDVADRARREIDHDMDVPGADVECEDPNVESRDNLIARESRRFPIVEHARKRRLGASCDGDRPIRGLDRAEGFCRRRPNRGGRHEATFHRWTLLSALPACWPCGGSYHGQQY